VAADSIGAFARLLKQLRRNRYADSKMMMLLRFSALTLAWSAAREMLLRSAPEWCKVVHAKTRYKRGARGSASFDKPASKGVPRASKGG